MNNESESKPVDLNRRRLAKTGLATPIVLATLASKNALANPAYRCTISGQLSNNFSPAGHGSKTDDCLFSLTPDTLKGTSSNWSSLNKAAIFNSYFGKNHFYVLNIGGVDKLVTASGNPAATLDQVINLAPDFTGISATERLALGRWCIVGIVNAFTHGLSYPLNEATIKKMYKDASNNGTNYLHGTDIYMNRVELVSYFRFLGGELSAPVINKSA